MSASTSIHAHVLIFAQFGTSAHIHTFTWAKCDLNTHTHKSIDNHHPIRTTIGNDMHVALFYIVISFIGRSMYHHTILMIQRTKLPVYIQGVKVYSDMYTRDNDTEWALRTRGHFTRKSNVETIHSNDRFSVQWENKSKRIRYTHESNIVAFILVPRMVP